MARDEVAKAEREEMKRSQIAINKSVKDIKPVDTTGVVLKNAPPTKEFLDKSQEKK